MEAAGIHRILQATIKEISKVHKNEKEAAVDYLANYLQGCSVGLEEGIKAFASDTHIVEQSQKEELRKAIELLLGKQENDAMLEVISTLQGTEYVNIWINFHSNLENLAQIIEKKPSRVERTSKTDQNFQR